MCWRFGSVARLELIFFIDIVGRRRVDVLFLVVAAEARDAVPFAEPASEVDLPATRAAERQRFGFRRVEQPMANGTDHFLGSDFFSGFDSLGFDSDLDSDFDSLAGLSALAPLVYESLR